MASWRTEAVERLAEMSGTDVDGAILPPPEGFKINRAPVPWYAGHEPKVKAAIEAERARG